LGMRVLGEEGAEAPAIVNGNRIATLPDKVRKHLEQRLGLLADD